MTDYISANYLEAIAKKTGTPEPSPEREYKRCTECRAKLSAYASRCVMCGSAWPSADDYAQ